MQSSPLESEESVFTLEVLASKTGNLAKKAPEGEKFSAAHLSAAVLHGWNAYEYHRGPVQLSEEDYSLALEAALTGETYEPANKR